MCVACLQRSRGSRTCTHTKGLGACGTCQVGPKSCFLTALQGSGILLFDMPVIAKHSCARASNGAQKDLGCQKTWAAQQHWVQHSVLYSSLASSWPCQPKSVGE